MLARSRSFTRQAQDAIAKSRARWGFGIVVYLFTKIFVMNRFNSLFGNPIFAGLLFFLFTYVGMAWGSPYIDTGFPEAVENRPHDTGHDVDCCKAFNKVKRSGHFFWL